MSKGGVRGARGSRELTLLADHGNFVNQQNGYGRERDPGGQRIPSEEVEGHRHPAGAGGYQSAADIVRCDRNREVGAKRVPEPEELTKSSDDDKKFSRNP